MLVDNLREITEWSGDDVVLANYSLNVCIVKSILFRSFGIDVIIHDFAIWVLFVESVREIKIAAIVAETVIIGIHILPSPVLGSQLAIARITVGDILAFVIVERPGETIAAFVQANLHRLHDIALKSIHILMRGDEQANALVVVSFDLFGLLTLSY